MSQDLIQRLFNNYKFVFLSDGNQHENGFRNLLAASNSIHNSLNDLHINDAHWKFFIAQYDLKNEFENLNSKNKIIYNQPVFSFFYPEEIYEGFSFPDFSSKKTEGSVWKSSLKCLSTPEDYFATVNQIKTHIQRGDIYELNYCISFQAKVLNLDPLDLFYKLNEISEAPFSGMFKMENLFVICASPERFLKKEHSILKTQPIKGTASRKSNTREDEDKRLELLNSEKEKNENVMIVDVARNDLSRISEIGKVQVEELFGVYSYRQVHQMVSTIRCELPETISFEEIIKSTFPMASMTGAPKIRAMEIIDRFENFRRQFYSGSMGYVDPVGNFDSNVIIRSVYYDTSSGELTFSVGSAITAMCEAEKEYEECLLKAKAIVEVIQSL